MILLLILASSYLVCLAGALRWVARPDCPFYRDRTRVTQFEDAVGLATCIWMGLWAIAMFAIQALAGR